MNVAVGQKSELTFVLASDKEAVEEALCQRTCIAHKGDTLSGVLFKLQAEYEAQKNQLCVVFAYIKAVKSAKLPLRRTNDNDELIHELMSELDFFS